MTQKYVTLIENGLIHTADTPGRCIAYRDNIELVEWVKHLQQDGYAFVDTPSGWPPAAVLQALQESGEMDFSFIAITWSGPGGYRTYRIPE